MVDETAFYVGSQNLYPSTIGDYLGPELNEYGWLIDDTTLATQIKESYWIPIWSQIEAESLLFRSDNLPPNWDCQFYTNLPLIQK